MQPEFGLCSWKWQAILMAGNFNDQLPCSHFKRLKNYVMTADFLMPLSSEGIIRSNANIGECQSAGRACHVLHFWTSAD